MNIEDPYVSPQSEVIFNEPQQSIGVYATFWQRFAAAFIDGVITGIMGAIAGFILGFAMASGGSGAGVIESIANILGIVIGWLYGALLESSHRQATWGKQMMKIKVSGMNGERISFAKASGRHFAKILSALILLIGYFMMLWTEKKQTLHDIMSGCLVTQNRG